MSQTRLASFVEVCVSTITGYIIAIASQLLIFPMFNIHVPFKHNLMMGVLFTILGFIRGYVIRRLFDANKWFQRK